MLSFLTRIPDRRHKKAIEESKTLLRMAAKVLSYRKDLLNYTQIKAIEDAQDRLYDLLKTKDYKPLKEAYTGLKRLLCMHGGKIYPVSFWSENVEMFIVAAILALGIRTFFIQPFKIPTNSMYPTYAGMVPRVYHEKQSPSFFTKLVRIVTLGAQHYELVSPEEKPVIIPIFNTYERMQKGSWARFRFVKDRHYFGLLPCIKREYTIHVGESTLNIRVPQDFCLDDVLLKTFFQDAGSMEELIMELPADVSASLLGKRPFLHTGKAFAKGVPILNFDIETGDMLFVNRFIYHFKAPQVGDPIVFKTGNLKNMEAILGSKEDKYYIKRLVGQQGDVLKIEDFTLYRNSMPISGALAFEGNAKRLGEYCGYRALAKLKDGEQDVVEQACVYAMGDNSAHSFDSRYWGGVPKKELVGKALFIFYPFSQRWGGAK